MKENHISMKDARNNIESFQQFYKRRTLWFQKLANIIACDDQTEIPRLFLKAWCYPSHENSVRGKHKMTIRELNISRIFIFNSMNSASIITQEMLKRKFNKNQKVGRLVI